MRQRREARRSSPRRCRRAGGAARVHLIDISSQALEQTEQRLGTAAALLGRRAPVTPTRSACAARPRRATRAAARCSCCSSDRTSATSTRRRRSTFLRESALALAPGDLLLLGADLVKPEARAAARLRRSARRHRRVQPEPARPHQPRARRRRSISTPSRTRGLEPRRTAHRDAPGEPRDQTRDASRPPDIDRRVCAAASASGPRARTSTSRIRSSAWASRRGSRCATSGSTARRRFALSLMIAVSTQKKFQSPRLEVKSDFAFVL